MIVNSIRRVLTALGTWSASPIAFGIVIVFTASWIVVEPETFDWHAVATLSTWVMTLFIQRAEHRDTQAVHAKLDELLRATAGASNGLTSLDEEQPEEIERQRDMAKSGDRVSA